jgi:hypothetical protein
VVTVEESRRLSHRAGALAAFTKHPSWPDFEEVIKAKIASLRRTAAAIALQDEGADQRKLDQIRGTIAALRWFVGVPTKAQGTLEAFLREHGLEVPDE